MTDWGLPDWTEQAAYPDPADPLTPVEMRIWAWEFLRRWPEYRVFWVQNIEPFIDVDGRISRDAAGNWWPYHDELKARFGVDVPSRPDSSTTAPRFVGSYMTWAGNQGGWLQIPLEKHQVACIIDLSRPLKRQFDAAHNSAKCEQRYRHLRTGRGRVEQYVLYLRILDAQGAGAKQKEIGELLFPKLTDEHPEYMRRKRLNDDQKAARALRDGGYRSLL